VGLGDVAVHIHAFVDTVGIFVDYCGGASETCEYCGGLEASVVCSQGWSAVVLSSCWASWGELGSVVG